LDPPTGCGFPVTEEHGPRLERELCSQRVGVEGLEAHCTGYWAVVAIAVVAVGVAFVFVGGRGRCSWRVCPTCLARTVTRRHSKAAAAEHCERVVCRSACLAPPM